MRQIGFPFLPGPVTKGDSTKTICWQIRGRDMKGLGWCCWFRDNDGDASWFTDDDIALTCPGLCWSGSPTHLHECLHGSWGSWPGLCLLCSSMWKCKELQQPAPVRDRSWRPPILRFLALRHHTPSSHCHFAFNVLKVILSTWGKASLS